jgi:hypothetical protein
MRSTLTALAVLAIVMLASGVARAEFVGFDNEPFNNNPATPDLLTSDAGINPPLDGRFGACRPAADVGIGYLSQGDVDYFYHILPDGCPVTAVLTPLSPTFTNPAASLEGGNSFGPIAGSLPGGVNNWFGPASAGAAIQFIATPMPDGWTEYRVTSPTIVEGFYALTISVVPEPATLALLLAGGLAMARRRR